MTNKIYERNRIVDVKEQAQKGRYQLKKPSQFAVLDSSMLRLSPNDFSAETKRDYN